MQTPHQNHNEKELGDSPSPFKKGDEKLSSYTNSGQIEQQQDEKEAASTKILYDLGVEWKDLDIKKFLFLGSSIYLAENALFYPFDLIRTRMQVDTKEFT